MSNKSEWIYQLLRYLSNLSLSWLWNIQIKFRIEYADADGPVLIEFSLSLIINFHILERKPQKFSIVIRIKPASMRPNFPTYISNRQKPFHNQNVLHINFQVLAGVHLINFKIFFKSS